MESFAPVILASVLSLVIGFFGKVLWSFFTDDKKVFDKFELKLDQMSQVFLAKIEEFSKKLELHNSEFTKKFHELEKTIISTYVRKEDLESVKTQYAIMHDEVKDSQRDVTLLKAQVADVIDRLNSGVDRRVGR